VTRPDGFAPQKRCCIYQKKNSAGEGSTKKGINAALTTVTCILVSMNYTYWLV